MSDICSLQTMPLHRHTLPCNWFSFLLVLMLDLFQQRDNQSQTICLCTSESAHRACCRRLPHTVCDFCIQASSDLVHKLTATCKSQLLAMDNLRQDLATSQASHEQTYEDQKTVLQKLVWVCYTRQHALHAMSHHFMAVSNLMFWLHVAARAWQSCWMFMHILQVRQNVLPVQ